MKKTFCPCLFAISILAVSSLAMANNDAISICPSLAEIQNLALKKVEPAPGKNRYNVSTEYQIKSDSYYTFYVRGVKATGPENALQKVKDALSVAVSQQPTATRVDPSSYSFNCVYSLDFSKAGDEYNGAYPVALVEISTSNAQNLYALPENLNIKK
ncbi:MAG: hypothetical protein K0S27_1434 [Gammaproteobacteria bacterium]|jgi:hypothetical protein|nr:hypothetical protein [Gammaproteobacteria bacterium]